MATVTRKAFDRKSMPEYPFDIGYRWVKDGRVDVQVPLTEEDFLHPQEEDRFLLTKAHSLAVTYIQQALERTMRGRPGIAVFFDHRIDWQRDDLRPMGPDVAAFGNLNAEWDDYDGTFAVGDLGATPLLIVEVTSPSTRQTDLELKPRLYRRAGVPYLLIADLAVPAGEGPRLLAYRDTRRAYVEMKPNEEYGVWIPTVELWFKLDDDRVVCHDRDKRRVLDDVELADRLEDADRLAKDEKHRADSEKRRADSEKHRADELERTLAELRAKMAQPSPKKNGHK